MIFILRFQKRKIEISTNDFSFRSKSYLVNQDIKKDQPIKIKFNKS